MTIGLIQLDSIRVPQSEVVPSELKQFVCVYTTTETEPFQIDLNLCAGVQLITYCSCIAVLSCIYTVYWVIFTSKIISEIVEICEIKHYEYFTY